MKTVYVPDRQVIEGLLKWLNASLNFEALGIKEIKLEQMDKETPCMALYAEPGSYKESMYVGGDFRVGFKFRVDFKGVGESTNNRLTLSSPLNYLAGVFDGITITKNWGDLDIGAGRKPSAIEMVGTPAKVATDASNVSTFSAFYQLTYEQERQLW